MSRKKDRISEQKTFQHLVTYLENEPKWSSRMHEFLDQMVYPIAQQLDQTMDEVADQLLDGPYVSMAYGYLIDEFVSIRWDNEPDSLIEMYLKRRGWRESPVGRRYLTKLNSAIVKLYEVVHVVPGKKITLKEFNSTTKPIEVFEEAASESLKKWDCVAGRVLKLHGRYEFAGGLLMLPQEQAKVVERDVTTAIDQLMNLLQKDISSDDIELSDDDLIEHIREEAATSLPEIVFKVWGVFICTEMARDLPELRNTAGDRIEIVTVQFKVTGGKKKIREALDSVPVFDANSNNEWAWVSCSADEAPHDAPSTLLGHINLTGKHVELHVNSRERSEEGIRLLETALLGLVDKPLSLHESLDSVLADHSTNDLIEDSAHSEDMQAFAAGFMDDHYRKTLDEPIPMLGNKSPRECAADPALRYRVVDWLKHLENSAAKDDSTYDIGWMWAELSLSPDDEV